MSAVVLVKCDHAGCTAVSEQDGTRSTVVAVGRLMRQGWTQALTGELACPAHSVATADLVERQQCARCADGDHGWCAHGSCSCACLDATTSRYSGARVSAP